jgi:hypothetical protein
MGFATLLIAVGVVAGCQRGISKRIESNLAANEGTKLDLRLVVVSDWDRVCIFGPYTDNSEAKMTLGFEWDIEARTDIRTSDGINVLAFVKDSSVLDYVEHPRSKGDFAQLRGKCLDRDHAVLLSVRRDGWMSFVQPRDE